MSFSLPTWSFLPFAFALLSGIAVADLSSAELQPINASKFKIKAIPDPNHQVSDISSANFFITKDNGQTWKAVEAARVVRPEGETPHFIFEANGDGSYGFWTQIQYSDGSQDKTPQIGSTPPTVRLIDSTAPSIDVLNGGLIAGTESKLFLEWEVSDIHLIEKPVTFELSADLKTWTPFLSGAAAKGNNIISLPAAIPFHIRLSTQDLAKNSTTSKPIFIGLVQAAPVNPTPATKTTLTAQNSEAALPSLTEIEQDVDKELAEKAPPKAAPRPVVPPGHQDIIAPYADKPWPGKYTGEKEPEAQAQTSALASPEIPNIIDSHIAQILARREGKILFGKDAEQVLAAARAAVIAGNEHRATVLFSRLKDSTVAIEALPEEVEYYLSLNHIDKAMELVLSAPPEVMSTKMRVQEANLWLAKGKRDRAISILSGISPDETSHYKNARLLLARCYIDDKKLRSASTILQQLVGNQDSWAQAAQQLLDQIEQQ